MDIINEIIDAVLNKTTVTRYIDADDYELEIFDRVELEKEIQKLWEEK